MIEVLMHEGKWRLKITGETWQFKDREELMARLDNLLELKQQNGKIN